MTLKLQKRLTELEQEKQSLRDELENKEEQFQRARARVLETATFTETLNETRDIFKMRFTHFFFSSAFQDDAQFKKARGAELEYESLKVSSQEPGAKEHFLHFCHD